MGGTTSKTTSQVLTDIAVKASMNSILSCTTAATQNQMIQLEQVTGDVTIEDVSLKQGASVDSSCIMTAQKQAEISNAVANAIAQYADSQGQAVLSSLGNTRSEAASSLTTQFQNSIDANTQQQLNTNMSQTQGIQAGTVGGSVVIKNVSLDQSTQVAAQALMNTTSYSSVINNAANKMDQTSSSKETTIFDSFANAITSIFGILIVGGVIVLLVILVIIL